MATLDCINLSKKYDGKTVVHDISISLQENSVIGLLGPNGAGKTTTFYMLVGLIKSNSGIIKIDDQDYNFSAYAYEVRLRYQLFATRSINI